MARGKSPKTYPHRFAALVPVCGGVFWSYQPDRWREVATLPERIRPRHRPHSHLDFPRLRRPHRQPAPVAAHVRGAQSQRRRCPLLGVRRHQTQCLGSRLRRASSSPTGSSPSASAPSPNSPRVAEQILVPVHPVPAKSIPRSTTPTPAITKTRTKSSPPSTARETSFSPAIASAKSASCCPRTQRLFLSHRRHAPPHLRA